MEVQCRAGAARPAADPQDPRPASPGQSPRQPLRAATPPPRPRERRPCPAPADPRHSPEHIAGARGRQGRRGVGIDDGAAVRCRDHGIRSLQHDHCAAQPGGRARARQLVAHDVEQARELALMRRDHTGSSYGCEQIARPVSEHADGVGIEQHRTAGREHCERAFAGRLGDPGAGSDQQCAEACIRQQPREIVRLREGPHHDAGERRRIHRHPCLRNRDGGEPGTGARGGARRHARRSGHRVAAAQQRMAARIFAGRSRQPRQLREPQLGAILPGVDGDALEDSGRRADIGDHGGAAQLATRQQQVSRLLARERHGAVGSNGAERFAGISHEAARHIDGQDGQPALRRGRQYRCDVIAERPAQSGSEQRIDDEPGSVEHAELQRLDATGPTRRVMTRLAAQALARPQQGDPHRPAGRGQCARYDEAVAAVVAGTAQNYRRAHATSAAWLRAPPRSRRCDINSTPGVPAATVKRSASSICATRSTAVLAVVMVTPPLIPPARPRLRSHPSPGRSTTRPAAHWSSAWRRPQRRTKHRETADTGARCRQ